MKKITLTTTGIICLFLSLVFFNSCQKDDNNQSREEDLKNQSTVSAWIDAQSVNNSTFKENWLSNLKSSTALDKMYSERINATEIAIVVPLDDSFESSFNRDKSKTSALILTTDSKTNEVVKANVLLYKTANGDLPKNFLADFNSTTASHVDGEFTFLKTFDRYLFTTYYENNIPRTAKMIPKREGNGEISTQTDCYQLVLVTTYYGPDGAIIQTIETPLGTYCTGGDCPPSDPGCVDTGDNPGPGGGGGGGTGGGEENCQFTAEVADGMLAQTTTSVSSDGSYVGGAESLPDANGIIEKNLLIDRDRVNFHTHLNYSFKYAVLFNGVIFKTTTNSAWKWKSLAFNKLQFVEGGTPLCMSESTEATISAANISPDKSTASWSGFVTSTLTVPCLNGYRAGTNTVTLARTYYAIDFSH